jgi:hypothetical protein
MESILISSLELVKCTYKKKHFFKKISLDNVMLINDFLENNDIKINRVVLTNDNFKLTVIDKSNTNYAKFENKIGDNFYPKIDIDSIIEYIFDQMNKPQNDYVVALKNIMVETECLQTENKNNQNNNLVLTEYLSDTDSNSSIDSDKCNTINFNHIDTIINI